MSYINNTKTDEDLKDWFSTIIVSAEVEMNYNVEVKKEGRKWVYTYKNLFDALLELDLDTKRDAIFFIEANLRKSKDVARKDLNTLIHLYVKDTENED